MTERQYSSIDSWPYAEEKLLGLLDGRLIESHAQAQLSRALNIERVVAVVGSGVTNAYNRPSWQNLLQHLLFRIDDLRNVYQYIVDTAEKTEGRRRRLSDFKIERLFGTIDDIGLDDPLKPYRGDFTIAFQVCEALESALIDWFRSRDRQADTVWKENFHPVWPLTKRAIRNVKRMLEQEPFRRRLQYGLFDERGRLHTALDGFQRAIEQFDDIFGQGSTEDISVLASELIKASRITDKDIERQKILPPGEDDNPFRRRALNFYSPRSVETVLGETKTVYADLGKHDDSIGELREKFHDFHGELSKNRTLIPYSTLRFLHEAMLTHCVQVTSLLGKEPEALKTWMSTLIQPATPSFGWAAGQPRRIDLSPRHLDPLLVLDRDLNIERYLTTNYDNEIEIALRENGAHFREDDFADRSLDLARPTESPAVNVISILGSEGKDVVFDEDRIMDLVEFGVHGKTMTKQVMHLHGRAVSDAGIVVTEKDYQDLYVREEGNRKLIDNALEMTFGSSPLLFLGLGMTEADILRPLRAFNSQRNSLNDRVGIAVLPRLSTLDEDTVAKHKLRRASRSGTAPGSQAMPAPEDRSYMNIKVDMLSRYGIYTIHYGSAKRRAGDEDDPEALAKLVTFVRDLTQRAGRILWHLYKFEESTNSNLEGRRPPDIRATQRDRSVSKLKDLCKVQRDAAKKLAGILPDDQFHEIEGQAGHHFPMSFEISLIRIANDWLESISKIITKSFIRQWPKPTKKAGSETIGELTAEQQQVISETQNLRKLAAAQLSLLVTFGRSVEQPIITAFFVAHLKKLQSGWSDWRTDWLALPEPRAPTTSPSVDEEPVWKYRHRVCLRNLHEEAEEAFKYCETITNTDLDLDQNLEPPWRPAESDFNIFTPTHSTDEEIRAAPSSDRYFEAAPPPSLGSLTRALKELPPPSKGRRIITILASRGSGKGHLFSVLRSNSRFADVCRALNLTDDATGISDLPEKLRLTHDEQDEKEKAARVSTSNVHRAFFDLGLSYEVNSIIDHLTLFLSSTAERILKEKDVVDRFKREMNTLTGDRFSRLEHVLKTLSTEAVKNTQRIVLGFNHLSVMVEDSGRPKNAQANRFLDLLFSPCWQNAPIDIFAFLLEDHIPAQFRAPSSPHTATIEYDGKVLEISSQESQTRLKSTPIGLSNSHLGEYQTQTQRLDRSGLDVVGSDSSADGAFAHLLSEIQPAVFAARFFPMAALGTAWTAVTERAGIVDELEQWLQNLPSDVAKKIAATVDTTLPEGGTTGDTNPATSILVPFIRLAAGKPDAPGLAAEIEAWPDFVLCYQQRLRTIFEHILDHRRQGADPGWLENLIGDTLCYWVFQDLFSRPHVKMPSPSSDPGLLDLEERLRDVRARIENRCDFFRERLGSYLSAEAGADPDEALGHQLSKYLFYQAQGISVDAQDLSEPFRKSREAILAMFRSLSNSAGHHRYGYSVVMATLDDMLSVELRRRYNCDENPTRRRIEKEGPYQEHRAPKTSDAYLKSDNERLEKSETAGHSFAFKLFAEQARVFAQSLKLRSSDDRYHGLREDGAVEEALSTLADQHKHHNIWPFKPRELEKDETDAWKQICPVAYSPEDSDKNTDDQETRQRIASVLIDLLDRADGHAIDQLMNCVLTELALIGQPATVNSLVVAPATDDALRRLWRLFRADLSSRSEALGLAGPPEREPESGVAEFAGPEGKLPSFDQLDYTIRRAIVVRVLDLLVHRCLVFRIAPKSMNGAYRYGVHKAVKRLIHGRLEMPLIDLAQIDRLNVSLYATQPNDLPRPSAATHLQLRRMIERLIEYEAPAEVVAIDPPSSGGFDPEKPGSARSSEKELSLEHRSERLRSAYGVLRSTYSAGVVCGFNSFLDSRPSDVPINGYIEHHRLVVRWMLRQAQSLDKLQGSHRASPPFYPEELTWLYNECGLLSMLQGKLHDAVALFGRASKMARENLESRNPNGALLTRIGLNRALCDIERGRMRYQRNFFLQTFQQEDESEAVRWIAYGYLGLLDHLKGNLKDASTPYDIAEQNLTRLERYRAAAIFVRHKADLLRRAHPHNLGLAHAAAERAVNLASIGKHEDVRHMALSSLVRTRIETGSAKAQDILPDLDRIEDYARVVGMPRLQVDTDTMRAMVLLQQGENNLACDFALLAMRRAIRLGLTMRVITSLETFVATLEGRRSQREHERAMKLLRELASTSRFPSLRRTR